MHTASALAPYAIETAAPPVVPASAEPVSPAIAAPRRKVSLARWIRPVVGFAILGVLLWQLGTGPFLDGIRLIDGWAVVASLAIGAVVTVCCGWRWSLIAGGLGVGIPLPTAVANCYRSVFLNATLPGGVLGDVHRAVSHGRDAGDVGRGIRAVVWERAAGQVVQAVLTLVVLFAFPSPVRGAMPLVAAIAAAVLLGMALVPRLLPHRRPRGTRVAKALRTARQDVRDGLLAGGNWLRITVASAVIVIGQLVTFLIAARTAGSTAPLSHLIPLTLLALLAMSVPANVGGFGPREGVAAWAFGAAGLTATQGVTSAVVYGALVLLAALPGAAVLVARRIRIPATGGVVVV